MRSNECRVVILADAPEGGMAHYAANLSAALGQYCWSVEHIIGPDEGVATEPWWAKLLDRVRVLGRLRRFYNPSRGRRIARDILKRYDPTVVHVTASGVPCITSIAEEMKFHGVLMVYTVHDPIPHAEHTTTWGRARARLIERSLAERMLSVFDLIHVHSQSHRTILTRRFPELCSERIYVVQHGAGLTPEVAAGSEVPAELTASDVLEDFPLFFGRVEPYKGLNILFAAMRELVARHRDLRMVIAGSGPLPTIPQDIAPNLVLINRFIEDREIKSLFTQASFLVLPYLEATQSGVIPLAAAFGRPAVATRVGALPELIEHGVTGAIVEAGDPSALASAMQDMIERPTATRQMGLAALSRMQARYAWPEVARAHYGHYMSALRDR